MKGKMNPGAWIAVVFCGWLLWLVIGWWAIPSPPADL